ncbi:ubiquitin carboxyl-terminal hydrolase 15-like isoform X2 [Cynara cardunculus var. scolymus]|uniref:ubiquitin carboxyl-terminal hydrolase 15-like isoform X2 n=1 Tax=Cynara cardunculus var. scolymus TaxID=59895 RepID=UPI000D630B85|nr:ubiquitin carboxyl-terminal hydrolase 15-like isoform X2 [Cynara cardunculus var. scolymus]
MLHPRGTDLAGLVLVFVVLPLVAYILLGKWSEVSKKKDRVRVLAEIAAEESFRAEAMAAVATVVPLASLPKSNSGFHECARCFSLATTRCSRCKTVRYCSGKCQIIHWRQVHKLECQPLEHNSNCPSPKSASNEEFVSVHEQVSLSKNLDSGCLQSNIEQNGHENAAFDDSPNSSSGVVLERRTSDKHNRRKFNREISRREEISALDSSADTCSTSYDNKETFIRHKPKRGHFVLVKEVIPEKNNTDNATHEGLTANSPHDLVTSTQNGTKSLEMETELMDGWSNSSHETCEKGPPKKSNLVKSRSHSSGSKVHKFAKSTEVSKDQTCLGTENMGEIDDKLDILRMRHAKGNGIISKGFMKMIGLKKSSKHDQVETSEVNGDTHKKTKMLFPYEEFLKYFKYEAFDFSPRGLVNCGNSCYANAVVQCLMSTKPLTIYLLHRSHSRTCCAKSWCLMCELEHHVMMLRESGEPLSLSGILLHMRSVNYQIGGGSQEDAHEFLRVLITSMQSICLESLGGEDVVAPKLQETTFIQHTFGGQLRSKVKCLRCHHESDRYENIMDLNLEIYGWVESLEDALTQFTSVEDLDGENMYRCGRCAAYVRARKQLAIHEAPNILTIVLKRFQEGNYGKLNKCITYPDMLDMIPYMTGKDDIPPLYLLYGVVVHLDTMNASFSGHYISYVKDLQGNWSRIDDAQVYQVPLSQVMSEGAYILFYMRSSPRPPRSSTGKPSNHQASTFTKSKPPKSTLDRRQEPTSFYGNRHNYTKPPNLDFSDATSSDWSILSNSDDASFTTESTRDSFSTIDYTDNNTDPVSSIFNTTLYTPHDYLSRNTISCSRFSTSTAHMRFMKDEQTSVLKSYRLHNTEKAYCYPNEAFGSNSRSLYIDGM